MRINQTLVVLNLSENGMGDDDDKKVETRMVQAMLTFGTSIEILQPHFEKPKDKSNEAVVEVICNAMTKQDSTVDSSAFKVAMLQAFENPVQALADGLKANTSVQQLNVSSNDLKKEGMAALKELLLTSATLAEINLSANGIIGDGGQPILDQVVAETSFKWIQDEPGVEACLILRK